MPRIRRIIWLLPLLGLAVLAAVLLLADPASAAPTAPTAPTAPASPAVDDSGVNISVGGNSPSTAVTLILAIPVLSIAPSALMLVTSFPKILVVLALTRNALVLPTSPPNQGLTGLALFLTIFVMGPVFRDVNELAVQPYLDGGLTASQAYDPGEGPLKAFLLDNTRDDELKLMIGLSGEEAPGDQE